VWLSEYAHKTLRLNELLTRLGVALGGRPGALVAFGMGIKIGRDALLAQVRRVETAQCNTVRVHGKCSVGPISIC
jgi:hypothetical protein